MAPPGYNTNPSNSVVMPPVSFSDANTAAPSAHGQNNHLPSSSHLDTLDLPLTSFKSTAGQGQGILQHQVAATSASTLSSNPHRQKFSELGLSMIADKQQSQVQIGLGQGAHNIGGSLSRDLAQDGGASAGPQLAGGKYPGRPTGIPRISQGSKILKFQGMRLNGSGKNDGHHRSNDRLSNAGMQVMAIQERGDNGSRARQSSAVLNTLSGGSSGNYQIHSDPKCGGSSSHLENKKEIKDFITKIPGIKASIRL